MATRKLGRAWLLVTNATMLLVWVRVLLSIIFFYQQTQTPSTDSTFCDFTLTPRVRTAVLVSFLELINATIGLTRSKPIQILLFSSVRAIVELIIAPDLPSCNAWQRVLTVLCWSVGDTIRFSCFLVDVVLPEQSTEGLPSTIQKLVKRIRYTVSPVLFPIGATGEMLMALLLARTNNGWYSKLWYFLSALWPVGFYPLMKRLLKQRKKFLDSQVTTGTPKKKKQIKAV